MKKIKMPAAAGGWHALKYTFRMAKRVGPINLFKAMNARNACKTCALGMGGQLGGMRNELGHFPEVCKKSLQAMVADMQGALAESFFSTYSVKQLRSMSPRELETAGRLVQPLYLAPGATHFRSLTWDEAMTLVAAKLKATKPVESFFYFSGRSSNEAGFLLQLVARVFGTNHINNCSYYCHQASGVGLGQSIGTTAGTVQAHDIEKADLVFLIGGNPASNHPRFMTHLMRMRRRGGKVIVVNPVRETGLIRFRVPSDFRSMFFGTAIASEFVQVRIGGDMALLMGIAKALIASGQIDRAFIDHSTLNFKSVEMLLSPLSWQEIEHSSGISRQEIEHLATLYAKSRKTIFSWTMGITHHEHGTANVQWIVNLALMRGMLGKEHAGLLPIRGHSNVQGMGTVGVTPVLKEAIFRRFVAAGIAPPTHQGYDTMSCMDACARGEMRFAMALGGNLQGSNPDANYATQALSRLDTMVYLSTSLNTGHVHGTAQETFILPVQVRDEEGYSTTQESMFSFVRLSDGGKPRRHGPDAPRGEVAVISELAVRLFGLNAQHGPIKWADLHDANEIRLLMSHLIPGLEDLATIGETKKEFYIPGRAFPSQKPIKETKGVAEPHGLLLPTPSGKATFFAHPLPNLAPLAPDELRLMTVRSEGQFNTVVYEDDDLYRGQERRDVILIHPGDMLRLGFVSDQPIRVASPVGEMRHILVRPFDIKKGHALMYYPEANVLLDRRLDPLSLTPAFKSMVVRLQPEDAKESGLSRVADQRRNAATRNTAGFSMVLAWRGWLRRKLRPRVKAC